MIKVRSSVGVSSNAVGDFATLAGQYLWIADHADDVTREFALSADWSLDDMSNWRTPMSDGETLEDKDSVNVSDIVVDETSDRIVISVVGHYAGNSATPIIAVNIVPVGDGYIYRVQVLDEDFINYLSLEHDTYVTRGGAFQAVRSLLEYDNNDGMISKKVG
jgi:hypothetical protein